MLDQAMFDPPILLNRGRLPQLPMSIRTRRAWLLSKNDRPKLKLFLMALR
jgi:hypothetical protein